MREIGSEFWLDDAPTSNEYNVKLPKWLCMGDDQCLLLSGRSAIDYVLNDITNEIRSAYMPSYCCESMLQPFLDKNINIDYYDVIFEDDGVKYLIDYEKQCDIFFATSYFGFSSTVMDSVIESFSNRDVIVIEDITHRLLCEKMCSQKASYSIASLRKWFAIPSGGIAIKQKGTFSKQLLKPSNEMVKTKISAMKKKANYILECSEYSNTQLADKKNYLNLFSKFNEMLKINYSLIEIDNLSRYILSKVDIEVIKKTRCENAYFMAEALKKCKFITPMITISDFTKDCPLFFPIRISPDVRNGLRTYLVENEIYCPTHWPVSNALSLNSRTRKIYDEELSLICDQRYSIDDMARIVNKIGYFWRSI